MYPKVQMLRCAYEKVTKIIIKNQKVRKDI